MQVSREARAAAQRQLRPPAHQLASRLFCLSRSAILQPGYLTRVIVNCPSISQRPIHILEIIPSARESSDNVVPGYVVATLSDASGYPAQGNFGRGQSEESDLHVMPRGFPRFDVFRVSQPAQRTLKGEVFAATILRPYCDQEPNPRCRYAAAIGDESQRGCRLRSLRR